MRSPHLDRASPDHVNIVRDGQHGQRLVGVEVQIIHGTSMAEVAQDQVLLRALLRLTASQQPHRQDVEQVDLPRFRAHGDVPRRTGTEVHAHHGGIHLQRDDGRRLYASPPRRSRTPLRVEGPSQVPHEHLLVRAARQHVAVQLARRRGVVRVARHDVHHTVHVVAVRAGQLRVRREAWAHVVQ